MTDHDTLQAQNARHAERRFDRLPLWPVLVATAVVWVLAYLVGRWLG